MPRSSAVFIVCSIILMCSQDISQAYPYNGYPGTGIRRLLRLSLVLSGEIRGTKPASGAQLPLDSIALGLCNARGDSLAVLPAPDPALQKAIDALFPNRHESYSLALLDFTPGRKPRFAERRSDRLFNPGSVGKLAIAAGLFTELARLYPESSEQRIGLLKSRMVMADRWTQPNHHEVPVYDPVSGSYSVRAVRLGDTFSLYEWLDHTLSASSNAAASVVWKEVMLMRHFGASYPPSAEAEKIFFDITSRDSLRTLAVRLVNEPLRKIGIAEAEWKLGSLFTFAGKKIVPGESSYGSPVAIIKFLLAMERGLIVDNWSSLELKRMLYLTVKRIRYASSPALEKAAVFFKSGSLYSCKPEEGFTCGKYRGNVENTMNSVAIVEQPDGRKYMAVLMSNVLKKNSAVEHQSLATFIDRALQKPADPNK